jgi:ATP-binding cassette subfamily B protein
LRRAFGTVPQDVFMFTASIAENIGLGVVERDRIREAARVVEADRFIAELPEGYDTRLGERGANLSFGERQLLAFARALAVDPQVLVLDEATSSVDSETEAQIQRALDRLIADRTAIIIAHRLSTIRNVDRIVVLHHGVIRETGTHRELLERNGIYACLYRLQHQQAVQA